LVHNKLLMGPISDAFNHLDELENVENEKGDNEARMFFDAE
jgi:hypothetical protein